MSKIRIDLEATLINGQTLTFQSPADCSQITGLIVYYPEGNGTTSKDFKFVDAHGVDVGSGTISLFAENVLVKVVLDTDQGKAYVQNADTNAYLEEQFADMFRLSGGTMTGMINMLKGDSNAGIMNGENKKIFGYGEDGKFYTGDPEYPLTFRGSGGVPTYNGVNMPLIQTGTYKGTGKIGSSNPTSLTFDFVPTCIIISGLGSNGYCTSCIMFPSLLMYVVCENTSGRYVRAVRNITVDGTTISWYTTVSSSDGGAYTQMNSEVCTYSYIAFG